MTPRAIFDALDKCRLAQGFFLSEQAGALVIGGQFDIAQLRLWRDICSQASGSWCNITVLDSIELERNLHEIDLSSLAGEAVKISIRHRVANGAAHLFSIEGLRTLLASPTGLDGISVVRIATQFVPFKTRALLFEPWQTEPQPADQRRHSALEKRPQRYVRTLLSDQVVPTEADPWLLAEHDTVPSSVLSAWKEAATRWMVRTFVDEIFEDSTNLIAVLHGPPTRRLAMGREGPLRPTQFEAVSDAANWVFGEGTDTEVRHTLLTNELARNWPAASEYFDNIFNALIPALEGARTAYRAHLRAGSRETIRALSDLRRALLEEVQRVAQQTRDLATSLWRDVAIAIGAAAFRAVLDLVKSGTNSGPASGGVSAEKVYASVLVATMIYLLTSLLMSALINRRFFNIAANNRKDWQVKLYGFLSPAEFDALAGQTITKSVNTYRCVLWSSWLVTIVVCAFLLTLAIHTGWGSISAFASDMRTLSQWLQ
jgi:hypothetical protein